MVERPRTYLKSDARKLKLLELGLRLFATRSYEDVAIEDVAREAGMSKGLLYHYFGSKRAFYTEVIRFAVEALLERLVIDPTISGPDNVRRGLLAWFEFVAQQGDAYLAIMHGGLGADGAVGPILEDARRVLVQRILDGLEIEATGPASATQAEVLPPPALRIAVRSWIGMVETAALDWLTHRDLEPAPVIDILMAGLFAELLVASHHSPGVRVKLDLASGLRLIMPLVQAAART
jgi:AcrR family transcriptional regulator